MPPVKAGRLLKVKLAGIISVTFLLYTLSCNMLIELTGPTRRES